VVSGPIKQLLLPKEEPRELVADMAVRLAARKLSSRMDDD
jgi:hypothetical protein